MKKLGLKIKCPNCGSFNIHYYQDKIFTFHYKIKKNGEPYKRPCFKAYELDEAYGYVCDDCHSISGIYQMSDWKEKLKK